MSGSVTPARRPRDESDDEEDFEVSVDGESSARSDRSKRARLDEPDSDDEEEEEDVEDDNEDEGQEAPLLPDSFRRSPKGKGRAANGLANGHARPEKHQPGSIVRVTLTDFVTYTKAEFNPGPNLNMVIGPNGTGKSTLVCAICIGLGWATKHLGRGKDLDEFVKHGAKKGDIEIELAADPARHYRNPVITTRLKKGDKANAEYLIDGKKENKKRVQELAMSFSIQVDNLCQFLPQDRVVEFASLSPVDLLTETQRAAAPQQMSEWHEQLKGWRKDQKQQQAEQQSLAEVIKRQEDRQRLQGPDVERLRERATLQDRLNALEKMRPLPEYHDAKQRFQDAKDRKKDAIKEFKDLERRMEPNFAAVTQKEQYAEVIKQKAVAPRQNLVDRTEKTADNTKKKIGAAQERIDECKNQIEAEKNSMKTVKQSMPSLQRNVGSIKKAMENPPAEFDAAEMNEQIRQKTRQIRDVNEQVEAAQQEVGSLDQQMRQRTRIIEDAEREKQTLQSQAGQQMNKVQSFSRDAGRAWEWIQANRERFQGEVFGPPLVECRVKEERHAPAVESVIQMSDALAFTVTTKADFDMLTDKLNELRIRQVSVRSSLKGLDSYQAPMSPEALQRYGLQGWLLELLEGPEPVLAMLCDNRNLHQAAYASREVSQNQLDALQQSPISSWVTSKQSFMISRRREYGEKATSTRVQDLRPARFFTKDSVDHQQDSGIDRRIAEKQSEIDELNKTRVAKMQDGKALSARLSELKKEKTAIEQDKNTKQSQLSQFNALPTKLESAENKLKDAREKLAGSAERRMAIEQKRDAICLEKGQHAIDYGNSVDSLRNLHIQLYEAQILEIEANSDLERLRAQHAEEQRLLDERRKEVDELTTRAAAQLQAGRDLQTQCTELAATFTEEEKEIWAEINDWNMDKLNTEIVSLTARVDVLVGGGNENTLREFERRAQDIETKTRKLNEIGATLDELQAQITDVREEWEPQLDTLIEEISGAFAENFSKIQCAGEVGVYKVEDFENWAIQIKVKFRENEPLSLLDSHRQSGGERAVSTIFYLMALQSLARAPFRVVDEINQGMDPRNERLVHSRMVDIACAEARGSRQGSQYFLITPKLLQGLKYHPDMKVHCIASGEHMPDDFREIDFAGAAKRALELRGRREGVAAG